MPRLLETRHWPRDCQTAIVEVRLYTRTVERIWVLKDGGMLFRGLVHFSRLGRTAVGEAMTTFGFVKFRRFSVSQSRQAMAYAASLELALEPDDEQS